MLTSEGGGAVSQKRTRAAKICDVLNLGPLLRVGDNLPRDGGTIYPIGGGMGGGQRAMAPLAKKGAN